MTASAATKVPAHIRVRIDQTTSWEMRCDSCKQMRHVPVWLLVIGDYGFQLCRECVVELGAGLAAP